MFLERREQIKNAQLFNADSIMATELIHINDLIREKEKAGRAKDQGDIEALKEIRDAKVK